MSVIHINQIKANLSQIFNGLIDLSDYSSKGEQEKESAFLTRSLAAFAVMNLADISPEEAAETVTDGGQDNGIDAIYYNEN